MYEEELFKERALIEIASHPGPSTPLLLYDNFRKLRHHHFLRHFLDHFSQICQLYTVTNAAIKIIYVVPHGSLDADRGL